MDSRARSDDLGRRLNLALIAQAEADVRRGGLEVDNAELPSGARVGAAPVGRRRRWVRAPQRVPALSRPTSA